MATEIGDLNVIQDEDALRRMWQETDDFSRKKEIRQRMYRLREDRLKSYYITRETTADTAAIAKHKSGASSHAESLSDRGFLSMKSKEIRDSASPTPDFGQSALDIRSSASQSEQLAVQNRTTSSSNQTVEQRTYSSAGSANTANRNQGQTSRTTTTSYETTVAVPPSDECNATTVAHHDGQDLQNGTSTERSSKSLHSSTNQKYYTTSQREVVTSSATTVKSQQKTTSSDYSTAVSQNVNDRNNAIADNADYRLENISHKISHQTVGRSSNDLAQQSQQAIEYYDNDNADYKSPAAHKISTSSRSVHEQQSYSKPTQEFVTDEKCTTTRSTTSNADYETKISSNQTSETKNATNKSVIENQQNVNRNIMNELHKLDSYLSTEAVTSSPVPSSPASSYTTEIRTVDKQADTRNSKQLKPVSTPEVHEPTDHTTTYQQAYSKISVDTSATHNAFASSLRASPDRITPSHEKRSPSKTSLDRSTPDRSPRVSPEKSSCNDLSRKFTASYQNRVSKNSTHVYNSKPNSPTKNRTTELGHRPKPSSSGSDYDSDDSTTTYNAKTINSTSKSSSNTHNRQTNTSNTFNSVHERRVQQNRYSSPIKSSGDTSEGSVEREIRKSFVKSPDSSPERSAFRPVSVSNSRKTVEKTIKSDAKRQLSPTKPANDESPTRKQPHTISSTRVTSHQTFECESNKKKQDQSRPQKPSSPQLKSTSNSCLITNSNESDIKLRKQPSQSSITSPINGQQSSPKRQLSPQIPSNNMYSVENTVNRNQIDTEQQFSTQKSVQKAPTAQHIHKPVPQKQPTPQKVSSVDSKIITERTDESESTEQITPVIHSRGFAKLNEKTCIETTAINSSNVTSIADTANCSQSVDSKRHTFNSGSIHEKPAVEIEHKKPHRQPSSQTISSSNNVCIANSTNVTELRKQTFNPNQTIPETQPLKPKRLPSSQTISTSNTSITELSDVNKKPSSNQQEPEKPKRQPSIPKISSTIRCTVETTDQSSININKPASPSGTSKSNSPSKESSPTKDIAKPSKTDKTSKVNISSTNSTNKISKKTLPVEHRQLSPEKQSNKNIQQVETVEVTIKNQPKDVSQKKPKSSPIIDGRIVDVDEDDVVEEIKVGKITASNDKTYLQNAKPKTTSTSPSTLSAKEQNHSKPKVPKQRSASYNDFERKSKITPSSIPADESTDESSSSSSSSDSSSEDEREEVIIEEIFDEFGTPLPRDTNPLDAAIKTKQEIDRENQANKDISLIQEDKINPRPKSQIEPFIQQEKVIQEDDHDCLPPVQQVLGKDVDQAALNDFLEWERKQSHHTHAQSTNSKLNTNEKFTNAEKQSKNQTQPKIKEQATPTQSELTKKNEKLTKNQQKIDSTFKTTATKPSTEKKIPTKVRSDSRSLVKELSQTSVSQKSVIKKPTESIRQIPAKPISKQLVSAKDIIQPKSTTHTDIKVIKQLSNRSLKEKNNKQRIAQKLDLDHKTKSETIIKPTKPLNTYQRRVTDQVRTNTIRRTDTSNNFSNKENRDVSRPKVSVRDTPQKVSKSTIEVTVTKNFTDKHTNKTDIRLTTKKSSPIIPVTATVRRPTPTKTVATPKDKTPTTRGSPTKSASIPLKSTTAISKTEKILVKKPRERTASESSSSTSSASIDDTNEESTTTATTTVTRVNKTEYTVEKMQQESEELYQQKLQTLANEQKDIHLNVVVRMPSSSRETTPHRQLDDRFCAETEESGDIPRYADRVISPDSLELTNHRNNISLRQCEKITDLDEEDEISETEATITLAERKTKFLESAKETTTIKQTTQVEDDLFQNREQAVSKTKEMFESIAKNQAPTSTPTLAKPPAIVNRPSVFESRIPAEERGHDGPHKVVSKKLTEDDYNDYIGENDKGARVSITKITRSFEDKAAENAKSVVNVKARKPETRETSPSKDKSAKSTSPVRPVAPAPTSDHVESGKSNAIKISLSSLGTLDTKKSAADYSTTISHTNATHPTSAKVPSASSRHSSPSPERKWSPKQPSVSSPRTQSPAKELRAESPKHSSLARNNDTCARVDSPTSREPSPTSKSYHHMMPTVSSEFKLTSHTASKTDFRGDTIQTTTNRYDIDRKSPSRSPTLQQQPIEITQVEVKPSKHVFEHTAITKLHSKSTPIEETFSQTLSRYPDKTPSKTLTKPTESSARRATKSPSPERVTLELITAPCRSPSPPSEPRRKTTSSSASTATSSKRQKSPSPEKTTLKPRKESPGPEKVPSKLRKTSPSTGKASRTKSPSPETAPAKLRKASRSPEKLTPAGLRGKSRSPEKAPTELRKKSPGPEKAPTKLRATKSPSPGPTIAKRRKSPSPEKTTAKLRSKFQTGAVAVESKKKKFEKRLSTTGTDYQNRKKFFETDAAAVAQTAPQRQTRAGSATTATSKYEFTVRSATANEKCDSVSVGSRKSSRKSPSRSPSKSPERLRQPGPPAVRKTTRETTTTSSGRTESRNVVAPARTVTATSTAVTTTVEPNRFGASPSPERATGSGAKRKSPEKNVRNVRPFGVTLRRTTTPSTTKTTTTTTTTTTSTVGRTQHARTDYVDELLAKEKKIEEIFDLKLLEHLLERAIQYDIRSRIRAQIRLVKRQLETKKTSRTPSPEKSSPTRRSEISTNQYTPKSTSVGSHSEVDSRISGNSILDRKDKVKKRLFTDEKTSTSGESKSYFTSHSSPNNNEKRTGVRNESTVSISERNDLTKANQSTYQNDYGSSLTNNSKDSKCTTESIISSYGVGPTDENGKPLFGLRALRTSSDTKITEEDLDRCIKIKNDNEREITDNAGKPLFGLKALQKKSNATEQQHQNVSSQFETSSNDQQLSTRYGNNNQRTVSSERSSHVYSSRTTMKSDDSGNVSMYRDEVKGELFEKDGKEPTGKMIATRYTYHKPEGEEATVKTESTSSYLNSKSHSTDTKQIGAADRSQQDKWKSSTSTSKLGSSSLIRKISNEHFEKAQRKFSGSGDEAASWNENDRKRDSLFESSAKTKTSAASRHYKSVTKADSDQKFYSQHDSTESPSTDHDGSNSPTRTSTTTTSTSYSHQANGDQHPKVTRNDSFKDAKSKFQQATVSSSLKNVAKSADGRTSPAKLKTLETGSSAEGDNVQTESSYSSHQTKTSSSNQSSNNSFYYETKSYTQSSSNSQDLLNRTKDNGFRPRSEYTDEDNETSVLDKLVGKTVSLRELESVTKSSDSNDSTSTKAATLVRKFEKQQNKTKQNKEDINVEQIWDEDQLRELLEACTDYESRRQIRARLRTIMAENKASTDIIASSAENADIAPKNGECLVTTGAPRSQSSPSSIIEDSGTESGEDLRLLNPELLAEVRGALSKLESALPTLDTARRASIIPLVTKLQSCLQISQSPPAATGSQPSLPSSKRYGGSGGGGGGATAAKQQLRKNRHTIGVSREELADARKWLAENFLDDGPPTPAAEKTAAAANCTPMKYESKQYKPVKFTPIPPREGRDQRTDHGESSTLSGEPVEPSETHPTAAPPPPPPPQYRAHTEPDLTAPQLNYHKQFGDERLLRRENYSSDEGDVSSTEEEASKAEPKPFNGGAGCRVQFSSCYEAPKKLPTRFHQKNNKKMRMKRANTIDIPKLLACEAVTSSGDESICRSADELNRRNADASVVAPARKVPAPPLEIRTEKDKKFAAFLQQTMQDELQAKTVSYNPCAAGGAQWSNRFSNIKTAFECAAPSKSSSSPEDTSSRQFKPIRKAATTGGREAQPPAQRAPQFSHAPQSPFKPVSTVASFYDCAKPRSRDSGYDSHTNSIYQADHQSLPKHYFNSLDRKMTGHANAPKTYYTPMQDSIAQSPHRPPTHAIGYTSNGYKTDSHLSPYYGRTPEYFENYANAKARPYAPRPNYECGAARRPDYVLAECSARLPAPECAPSNYAADGPAVSPTVLTTCSSSPTYADVYEQYTSLPTSPLQLPKQAPPFYWKPVEYYEERPAHAKIMGKPQQAVVVGNKTQYRGHRTAPLAHLADCAAPAVDKPAHANSTYQKLAQKSPLLQNFTENVPRNVTKEAKPTPPAPKPCATVSSPVAPRKHVTIVAAALNDDEENLPEQFFVQNQRNKFESLSAGAGAPKLLPPQINEKAYFKPVSKATAATNVAPKKLRQSSPIIVQQCRSPPQSPVLMPSVLQKSESWHQMIMERMKLAKPPSPVKPKIPRAKSTHNLTCAPKQYEANLMPETIARKKQTVEQFLGKARHQPPLRQLESSFARTTSARGAAQNSMKTDGARATQLNEDFKHVDEAFELLFNEASGKKI